MVEFFEDHLFKILKHFEQKKAVEKNFEELETMVEGCIDVEELKFEVMDGLSIRDEIKPLEPYRDLSKFYYSDLSQALMRAPETI